VGWIGEKGMDMQLKEKTVLKKAGKLFVVAE